MLGPRLLKMDRHQGSLRPNYCRTRAKSRRLCPNCGRVPPMLAPQLGKALPLGWAKFDSRLLFRYVRRFCACSVHMSEVVSTRGPDEIVGFRPRLPELDPSWANIGRIGPSAKFGQTPVRSCQSLPTLVKGWPISPNSDQSSSLSVNVGQHRAFEGFIGFLSPLRSMKPGVGYQQGLKGTFPFAQ